MTYQRRKGEAARLKRIALDVHDLLSYFGTATVISYPAWRNRFRRELVSPIDGEVLREAPNEEANTRKWDRLKKELLELEVPLRRVRTDNARGVAILLEAGAREFVKRALD